MSNFIILIFYLISFIFLVKNSYVRDDFGLAIICYIICWLVLVYKIFIIKYESNKNKFKKYLLISILIVSVICRIYAFFIPSSYSDDHYRYVWDGMQTMTGNNPYKTKPSDELNTKYFHTDAYKKMNSKDYFTCYPPLAQIIFSFSHYVNKNFFYSSEKYEFYVLKIIFVFFELIILMAIIKINLKSLHEDRRRGLILIVIYALNPLVIIETWGQTHIETVSIALIILSVFILRKYQNKDTNKIYLSTLFLSCALWVKLIPVIFFIPYIFELVRIKTKNYLLRSEIDLQHDGKIFSMGLCLKLFLSELLKVLLIFLTVTLIVWIPFYEKNFINLLINIFDSLGLWFHKFEFYNGLYTYIKTISYKLNIQILLDRMPIFKQNNSIVTNLVIKSFFLLGLIFIYFKSFFIYKKFIKKTRFYIRDLKINKMITFFCDESRVYYNNFILSYLFILTFFYLGSSTNHPWYFVNYFALFAMIDINRLKLNRTYLFFSPYMLFFLIAIFWIGVISFLTYYTYSVESIKFISPSEVYNLALRVGWIGGLIILLFGVLVIKNKNKKIYKKLKRS